MLIARPETVQEVLVSAVRALGVRLDYKSARLEAELLLAHALGVSRAGVLARLADPLDPENVAKFAAMVARRAQGEPVPYILGQKEFYGLDLYVDRRVLIPRQETELLVELGLDALKRVTHPSPLVADVGTGSGAIALAMAFSAPSARFIATDISPQAIAVAKINAERLNLKERVEFFIGDLFEKISDRVDVVVANLPYIPLYTYERLPREIRRFEPRAALLAGLDGFSQIRRLLNQVDGHLTGAAMIFLEISDEQGLAAKELAVSLFPHAGVKVHRDLQGLDRVVEIDLGG